MLINIKKFETVDAVVKDLMCQNFDLLAGLEKDLTAQDFAGKFHLSIGAKIRNDYGLWNGNEALLNDCKVAHPDDASSVILQRLWQVLHSWGDE